MRILKPLPRIIQEFMGRAFRIYVSSIHELELFREAMRVRPNAARGAQRNVPRIHGLAGSPAARDRAPDRLVEEAGRRRRTRTDKRLRTTC